MGARLSLRPDLDQDVNLLALYISGHLPGARIEIAYEGRLSIHNAVGACFVEQVGGDELPPGSSVFVDNATNEIVVAWPAYTEYVTPLVNPGFETGDPSGWTLIPRGGVATAAIDSAQKFDGTYSLRWPGGKGLGSEGGIEVEAWNNTIAPCVPGRRVTIHTRCMYNPAGHNFGSRYQGLIRFLDSLGNPIGAPSRGKLFKGRGNNGRWNDASASAVGPAGTVGVQMGAWLTGSEAPTWLDAASWDVPSSLGVNEERVYEIHLRVRDSAGRTAAWSGSISVANIETDPYWSNVISLLHFDGVDGSSTFVDEVAGTTWAAVPGAGIDSTQSKFGGYSGRFPAGVNSGYGCITSNTSAAFALGSGDFTIEGFINTQDGDSSTRVIFDGRPNGVNGNYPTLYAQFQNIVFFKNNTAVITALSVIGTIAVWKHFALCRVSGVTRLFIDGVQFGVSLADTTNYANQRIRYGNTSAADNFNNILNGWLDECRVTKGIGRYASNFVPPTKKFPSG